MKAGLQNQLRRLFLAFSAGLLLAGCSSNTEQPVQTANHLSASSQPNANLPSVKINGRWETVKHVVDGDTVESESGEKIRLIGVNTPETVKPNSSVQPYGKAASDFTKSQLQGKKVFIEQDVQPKDKYGRTLAYLYLQEPKTEQEIEQYMFNAILLKEGYAQLMTIPPNVKYADLFVKLQRQARESNKGLWSLGIYKDSVTSTNDVFTNDATTNSAQSSQPSTPSTASTDEVKIVSLTSPVSPGDNTTLVAQVPPNTQANITVYYKSGTSKAEGLEPKMSDSNGHVSWTWKVGTRTTPGSWRVVVSAGGQSATAYLQVQ
ncbi:thermonuclease family protein [Effusibacillus dendaii]|uniref:TNase-like domain-containing protein n=1 Tax=Effusibacillus dendaii TaxID=2743772 RepID=A0A7I8D730_9BACL|nr:thermonuclease family protein [Effusibacillus dendaii]BCJ85894.1 hypothetical protein skT53_08790 [Effusibacillus dendaii]